MTIYLDCLLALIAAVTLWTFWPQVRWLARHLRTFARDFEALANLYRATDEAGMPERSRRPE